MYATEFKTFIDKPFIEIPEYENFKGQEVRVVLLSLDNQKIEKSNNKLDFFDKYQLDISNFRFDRDEANER